MRFDAILFNLHVIGQAVKSLPMDFREIHAEVAWRQIAGMRDFVAHSYFSLDMDILWNAIIDDVPKLLEDVRRILDSPAKTEKSAFDPHVVAIGAFQTSTSIAMFE